MTVFSSAEVSADCSVESLADYLGLYLDGMLADYLDGMLAAWKADSKD